MTSASALAATESDHDRREHRRPDRPEHRLAGAAGELRRARRMFDGHEIHERQRVRT